MERLNEGSKSRLFETMFMVAHSMEGSEELPVKSLRGRSLVVQGHHYRSNFVVRDARYEVILGMPWHSEEQPNTNYDSSTVVLKHDTILKAIKQDEIGEESGADPQYGSQNVEETSHEKENSRSIPCCRKTKCQK